MGSEELAATDRRIIHVRNGQCRDIGYGFLTSIQNGWSIDWKWGKRAMYAILASIIFACIGLALPALVAQGANSLSEYTNLLVGQITSATIPPAYQGSGGFDYSLMPGMQSISSVADFSGPAGAIGTAIGSAFTDLTILAVALSVLSLLAFFIQIKRVLVLTTLMDKDVFYYGRGQKRNVVELIKILRAESMIKNPLFKKT